MHGICIRLQLQATFEQKNHGMNSRTKLENCTQKLGGQGQVP